MPATAMKLLGMLSEGDTSLSNLSDVAVTEVGLSTALLRRVNSASMGLDRRVVSVADAILLLGFTQTRCIVLATGVSVIAQKKMPLYGLPAGMFTSHSEIVAQATMWIARTAQFADLGLAYSAGLLHDIGKIVLSGIASQSQLEPEAIALEMDRSQCGMLEAEETLFGATHAQVGKQLSDLWSLPASLGSAIDLHHDLSLDEAAHELPYFLAVANCLAVQVDPSYPRLSDAGSLQVPEWVDVDEIARLALASPR